MRATYKLTRVKQLVRWLRYRITRSAAEGASASGLDTRDIVECVLGLREADFYKTMPSNTLPGRWQDVYRPTLHGISMYLKLQVVSNESSDDLLVIVSCKER